MTKHAAVASRTAVNLKLILAVGLAVLFVGAIIVAAKPAPNRGAAPVRVDPQAGRMLSADQTSFDFGSISMAAGKVTHRYWIRNAGATPIVLRKMYTSCMCTTAALVKGGRKFDPAGMPGHGFIAAINEPINPNEAAMVEVVFDPAAHGPAGIGRIERTVTLQTDLERPLELALVANVTP